MRQFIARHSRSRLGHEVLLVVAWLAACGTDEPLETRRQTPPSPVPSGHIIPTPEPTDAGPQLDVCQMAQWFLSAEGAAQAVCASLVSNLDSRPAAWNELTVPQRCWGCSLLLRLASASEVRCPLPTEQCPLSADDVQACVEAAAPKIVEQLPDCTTLDAPPAPLQADAWLRLVATTPRCALLLLKCPAAQQVLLELVGSMARGQLPR